MPWAGLAAVPPSVAAGVWQSLARTASRLGRQAVSPLLVTSQACLENSDSGGVVGRAVREDAWGSASRILAGSGIFVSTIALHCPLPSYCGPL